MMFAHLFHVLVAILLAHLYLSVRWGRLDSRLGLAISVMAMASVFWSYGLAAGSDTHAWAPWLAIGMAVGGYCIGAKRRDP